MEQQHALTQARHDLEGVGQLDVEFTERTTQTLEELKGRCCAAAAPEAVQPYPAVTQLSQHCPHMTLLHKGRAAQLCAQYVQMLGPRWDRCKSHLLPDVCASSSIQTWQRDKVSPAPAMHAIKWFLRFATELPGEATAFGGKPLVFCQHVAAHGGAMPAALRRMPP